MTEPPRTDLTTDEQLRAAGLIDPPRARRIILSLAGQGVTDDLVMELLPSLLDALRQSPDPDRALGNFERWTNAVTSRYTHVRFLLGHPAALHIFFNVCGVSQFFSDILVRNPEYFEILANPGVRGGGKSGEGLYRGLSGFVDGIVRPQLKLEAMRRFREREILRIGTRDILGLADMPTTALEFSNLADACVQKCYEIGLAQLVERYGPCEAPPFAVIAMGKLGGQELNYSSDIDLMFVYDEPDEASPQASVDGPAGHPRTPSAMEVAGRMAELIVAGLSKELGNGHLFRVDMRLRPEGRFGALVRSLSSYRAYYESWAEPWERQALVKARPIAGDARLGEAFRDMVTPFVYRRVVSSEFVAAIRHNKERMERKAELEGQSARNVKVGRGAIRDIEFAVQLLQLVLGGRFPLVRTPNTLEAIARLRHVGALTGSEAAELGEDYQFLRTIEHRLQILYELQTQTLPTAPAERRLLARRLGYADADAFDTSYRERTERVRKHFVTIFRADLTPTVGGGAWGELLASVDVESSRARIVDRLRDAGFRDPESARVRLREAVSGGAYGAERPESRSQFLELSASLVAACVRTGDPDAALGGMDLLASAVPNRAELYRSLAGSEELLDRLCRLGAASPVLVQSLSRHLEWLDLLVSEEITDPAAKQAVQMRAELAERRLLPASSAPGAFWDGLALYLERERLRSGCREIWGDTTPQIAGAELTNLADAALAAVLDRAGRGVAARRPAARQALDSAAIIGLGKLGGQELGYASDWDILVVYDDAFEAEHSWIEALAEGILAAGQELRTRGAPVEIDARLRPEGRFGALARTVSGYNAHYASAAETWERQTLTKARFCAGCEATGEAYMRVVADTLYARPMSAEAVDEIRHMKRRIEAERLKAGERSTDLKLGHGGLSDIEFATQLWQMRAGSACPGARAPGTVPALRALGAAGWIARPDAARLVHAYTLLTSVRNRIALQGTAVTDVLPSDDARLEPIAVGLGFVRQGDTSAAQVLRARLQSQMGDTRSATERWLYGRPAAGSGDS